jgi:hypothetical protein
MWLQNALAQITKKSKIKWIELKDLPLIEIGEYCLNDEQIVKVILALKQSNLENPHPLVTALKKHSNPIILDSFAWNLCEQWLQIGASSKDKWTLIAVGLLGTDTSVVKLADLIPIWRKEGYYQRAVLGLQCLQAIGTDTALMRINQIAQTRSLKALRAKAQACMESIAKKRGLTPEQLEDRIIPTCGLDAQGSRIFDYGSRQFQLILGQDMKPTVRDEEGKLKANLPKPKASDDAELVSRAIAEWKWLKKQLSDVIKVQIKRLERAMIDGRAWQTEEFKSLLVEHPVMGNLVRSLIWVGYDKSEQLMASFRVTEDRTYADIHDEGLDLTDIATVGILHPAQLSEELRAAWGELMSDYEIMAPFRQLSRTIFTLESDEYQAYEITRFQNISIPYVTLASILEGTGWIRGTTYCKPWVRATVTAVLEATNSFSAVYRDDRVELKRCFFIRGIYPQVKLNDENAMRLDQVDAVVMSEVLRNLGAVASKGEN